MISRKLHCQCTFHIAKQCSSRFLPGGTMSHITVSSIYLSAQPIPVFCVTPRTLQSFQMKTEQLHVFRSPQARATSPSVPRGTKSIVCIPPGFLPAVFTSNEYSTVCLLTQTRPKVTSLRLPGTSNSLLVLTGP